VKRFGLFGLLIFVFAGIAGYSQTESFYVKPKQTDNKYLDKQAAHFIVRNKKTHLNKLVLFIGGTGSRPKNYTVFCNYAAELGYDVISISYPNEVAAMEVAGSGDSLAFNKYRQEICFGTPLSDYVSVDSLNSVYTRFFKLIKYLSSSYPAQNWKQYLDNYNNIDWSKIIVAGHSQGSGHACHLAKRFNVERALMFSGPNDYSTYYNKPANWLRQKGISTANKYFALLHLHDEIVSFSKQYANLKALGLVQKDDTTRIENTAPLYRNSHLLYTVTPSLLNHNSPVGKNPIIRNVWKYMLTKQ
jgi:pimeloyl-ACP methyl ester carboxylesterase